VSSAGRRQQGSQRTRQRNAGAVWAAAVTARQASCQINPRPQHARHTCWRSMAVNLSRSPSEASAIQQSGSVHGSVLRGADVSVCVRACCALR
jgi:hypothetical protein